jgi:ribosome assembly protein SQT1
MLPRANLACSGGGDDKAYLWNYLTGEQIGVLLGHSDSVIDVGFNHDGSYVATAGMDGKVIVSLVPSCEQVCVLDGPNEIVWINWHPRGNVLSAGADDGTVWMWSVPKGVFMGVFSKHEDSVTCGGFSRDGKYVISGSADSSLIFWDPKNYSQVWKMGGGHDERWHKSSVCSFATSQDGRIIATGDEEGFIRLTVAQTGKLVGSLDGHENSVNALHFCPEMK